MQPYIIDGITIERVAPKGPYSLVIVWKHGVESVQANGHNPQLVRAAESQITRNSRVISRIELRDLTGPLETIWAADWI
jgi:hypothetical protein